MKDRKTDLLRDYDRSAYLSSRDALDEDSQRIQPLTKEMTPEDKVWLTKAVQKTQRKQKIHSVSVKARLAAAIICTVFLSTFAIAYAFSEDVRISTNNFVITLLGGEYGENLTAH